MFSLDFVLSCSHVTQAVFPLSSFQMTTELSALARLLVYPRHQTLNELNKIDHILQNSRHLDPHTKENLKIFTVALSAAPMSALQNIYLASFEEDYKTLDLTQQNHESAEALKLLENLYHEHDKTFPKKTFRTSCPQFWNSCLPCLTTKPCLGLNRRNRRSAQSIVNCLMSRVLGWR